MKDLCFILIKKNGIFHLSVYNFVLKKTLFFFNFNLSNKENPADFLTLFPY